MLPRCVVAIGCAIALAELSAAGASVIVLLVRRSMASCLALGAGAAVAGGCEPAAERAEDASFILLPKRLLAREHYCGVLAALRRWQFLARGHKLLLVAAAVARNSIGAAPPFLCRWLRIEKPWRSSLAPVILTEAESQPCARRHDAFSRGS